MIATYRAAANFIVKTRDRYPKMIYTNVSFVGSTALSEELLLQGERFADGVIVTQVVPAVSGYSRAVLDYKAALAKYFPGEAADYVSFEGYIVGKILVEGLRRVGPQVDTEKLIDALESIHDLEDIVKRIARSEKIDESREFAADIQESLAKRIQKLNKTVKDRGVRKAPFVVLVGADMPSILTEISFLSNPADEQLLKKPEHRQRVAEGLYQGMAAYLQNLNSMSMNVPGKTSAPSGVSAAVEQSRNQR